jgi:hypothetical protein
MLYMSTFCSFSLWVEDTFFDSKKGSVPHKPVLTEPNLLRAQLAIATRVGGSAKVTQVICYFFAKMRLSALSYFTGGFEKKSSMQQSRGTKKQS